MIVEYTKTNYYRFAEIGEIKEFGTGYTFFGVDVKVRRGVKQK